MAVLIPDMDYPKRCGDCDFCIMFTDNMTDRSYFRCVHLYEDANTEKKRGDCPLVEVPAHGDLVDVQRIEERAKQIQYDKGISYKDALVEAFDSADVIVEATE